MSTDLNQLPRYTFHQTDVGCARHGDPDCLCDVTIGTIMPIAKDAGLLFGQMAVEAVGGNVTHENVVTFASVLLGCYGMFRDQCVEWTPADDPDIEDSDVPHNDSPTRGRHEKPIPGTRKDTTGPLSTLPPGIRWTLYSAAEADMKWSAVKSQVPVQYRKRLMKPYAVLVYRRRSMKKKVSNKTTSGGVS